MVRVFYDDDTDLAALDGQVIAIIGYGNQGRAQALNLRDSGLDVIVGNIRDAGWEQAESDGFAVFSIADAVEQADVLCLLVPDEVQRTVFADDIRAHLGPGKTLDFAHGYNIHYGFLVPPPHVDVVMVAPRMIGTGVRASFVEGSGAPAFIGVWQDASGRAWQTALALAKGIGATRGGAIQTTFAEETELDHFMEQAVWAAITRVFVLSFEFLVEAGYPPEVVALELYGSKEAAQVLEAMADVGFFRQMSLHSQTSQYGTMTRGPRMVPDAIKEGMAQALEEIQTGVFAREWELEQMLGYPTFSRLKERALRHPLNEVEDRLRGLLRREVS